MRKRAILIIILSILSVLLKIGIHHFSIDIEGDMVSYCEEKYDTEFEFIDYDLSEKLEAGKVGILRSKNGIECRVYRVYDGNVPYADLYYQDNYYVLNNRVDLNRYLSNLLGYECSVSEGNYFINSIGDSVVDTLSTEGNMILFNMYISSNDYSNDLSMTLGNILKNSGISSSVSVCVNGEYICNIVIDSHGDLSVH